MSNLLNLCSLRIVNRAILEDIHLVILDELVYTAIVEGVVAIYILY